MGDGHKDPRNFWQRGKDFLASDRTDGARGAFKNLSDLASRIAQSKTEAALQNQGPPEYNLGSMFRNRLLPERGRIEFHYGGMDTKVMFLPFYENPVITETQSANYSEYNPVGRGGSLYAYMGSKSRKINVDMTFTLDHLAMHEMGIDRFRRIISGENKEISKSLFVPPSDKAAHLQGGPGWGKGKDPESGRSLSTAAEKHYWMLRLEDSGFDERINKLVSMPLWQKMGLGRIFWDVDNPADKDWLEKSVTALGSWKTSETNKVIDTLLFFIALLRTSVVNKADDPLIGPPMLRLNFGTLYKSVPCICKSYNMKWEEDGGYDVETLTPRILKVSLKLEEIRVGNWGSYQPAQFVARDNLAGWESAVDAPYTTDPLPLGEYWQKISPNQKI